ncbi:MAG: hypothetical protein PUN43_00710 [Candidatus Liberibacter asiaticus]|nr:hypothetical protein [Candidatus Liberibacter asiaticus]
MPAIIQTVKSIIIELFHCIDPSICPIYSRIINLRFCLCGHCWSKIHFITATEHILKNNKDNIDKDPLKSMQKDLPLTQIRSVTLYCDMSCVLVRLLKYHDRTDLAIMMAQWMFRVLEKI